MRATAETERQGLQLWYSKVRAMVARLLFLCALSAAGCALSPSVNILGSFFPAWLICIVAGLLLALIAWRVLIATGVAPYLTPAGLVYPCLAALVIFASWLILFAG